MSIWKFRLLSAEEEFKFRQVYDYVASQFPVFQFIIHSEATFNFWWIMMLGIFLFRCIRVLYSGLYSVIICAGLFALGIIALQVMFVLTHMQSHALFLEYDEHHVGSERVSSQPPIYFFAFVHHHQPKLCRDDMSGETLKSIRHIIGAHFHGFTITRYPPVLISMLILNYLSPLVVFYYAGYEIAALLLGYAHIWQHKPKSFWNPVFRCIMNGLSSIGFIATARDHDSHHHHNHPTVYQDFSSSGLYMKRLDKWLNTHIWDKQVIESTKDIGNRPYDRLKNLITCVSIVIAMGFPILICLLSIF